MYCSIGPKLQSFAYTLYPDRLSLPASRGDRFASARDDLRLSIASHLEGGVAISSMLIENPHPDIASILPDL
ncbi:MAG: hypothetical protein E3J30_09340 [Anaerolineales bacterium]|nr:MAG: hypothetical protein E3J30_09340 [Anaerolineales bacterium]